MRGGLESGADAIIAARKRGKRLGMENPNNCGRDLRPVATNRGRVRASPRIRHERSGDLGFDELRQEPERLLPSEIAGLGRDHFGNPFLHDRELGSD